jgi:hypothetical protein
MRSFYALPEFMRTLLLVTMAAQAIFSCLGVSIVTWRRHQKPLAGAFLWALSYWLKSMLIIAGIMELQQEYYWPLVLAAVVTFAAGDAGLLLLWSGNNRVMAGSLAKE